MQTVRIGSRMADVNAYGEIIAVWETVAPLALRVGDITPVGEITAIEYHGEIGITVTIDGMGPVHRGMNDLVSRQVRELDDDHAESPAELARDFPAVAVFDSADLPDDPWF